ncbi:thiopeptide-type bacteriocin biosynthesis protein [Saccharopolyspora sp. CA-218241]|uniref:thiopeptide-type bacteriocin biosynthesis protein n=1 Tax=Saccharopolyspora sp. CA-218241 TaxID=3240027 RepID=UPI003D9958EC
MQVSCRPLHVSTENVSRAPAVLPQVLRIGEHNVGPVVLDDIAVTADEHRLRLLSRSTGEVIEPTVFNAVELVRFTHPLVRFLCELPVAHSRPPRPFTWGAAECLPFLPRLRYGRTVLSPARWRLRATDLPGREEGGLADWADHCGVPEAVQVADGDQSLRLDLRSRGDVHLLLDALRRTGELVLSEAADDDAYGWFDGRAHELVVPLATTRASTDVHPHTPVLIGRDHGELPGADLIAVQMLSHPDRDSDLLTVHVPRLLRGLDVALWWFDRAPKSQRPLVYLRPHRSFFADCARTVEEWARDLRERGLLNGLRWETYYPEVGSFGSGEAMAAAEAVFAADSAAAIEQLDLVERGAADGSAVTAASIVDLVDGFHPEAGSRWLAEHLRFDRTAHPRRHAYQEAVRLTQHGPELLGERVSAAWAARRDAVHHLRKCLTSTDAALTALIRAHQRRTAQGDVCARLARSAAATRAAKAAS